MIGGAHADNKSVTYSCTPYTAPNSPGTAVTHDFNVTLTSLVATATVGTQFTATLAIAPESGSSLPAPVAIASGKWIENQPTVVASVAPTTATAAVSTPSPSVAITTEIAPQAAIPTIPVATVIVTPSTGATSIVLTAKDFKLNVLTPATAGVAASTAPLYDCKLATTGAKTLPAVATIPVTTAAGTSTTPSSSASTSASATPTTPRPTRTIYKTVTAKPHKTTQVTHTPGGGAATGGGGEMGPDGRVLVLSGTALILAAATGGLMLRARRRAVRH